MFSKSSPAHATFALDLRPVEGFFLLPPIIIKVAEYCIWFHGKADWDDEAKSGIFTIMLDHKVTSKIIVRPSLETVILTHEMRPKLRLFRLTK